LLRHQRRLQRPNRTIERQAMRLQRLRRHAPPVPDDRGKDNRPVDVAATASPRRCGGSFQNAPHVRRNAETDGRIGRRFALRKLPGDIRFQGGDIDVARVEHCNGVTIVAKRRKQMLQRHVRRTGTGSEFRAARQRCAEVRRHRNLTKFSGSHAHDVSRMIKTASAA